MEALNDNRSWKSSSTCKAEALKNKEKMTQSVGSVVWDDDCRFLAMISSAYNKGFIISRSLVQAIV